MAVLRLVPSQGSPVPIEISSEKVVVGREPTCDVVVSDGSVSRKHAIVEQRGTGWAVVDQGSANGTFVGGRFGSHPNAWHTSRPNFTLLNASNRTIAGVSLRSLQFHGSHRHTPTMRPSLWRTTWCAQPQTHG